MKSGIYGIGDTIQVAVNFDGPVTVTGSPGLKIQVGSSWWDGSAYTEWHPPTHRRTAEWVSTSGSTVTFAYTVVEGDRDKDGISILADSIVLGSGDSITDANGNAVSVSHAVLSAQADHIVDGIRPRIRTVNIPAQNDLLFTPSDNIQVFITFSEDVIYKQSPRRYAPASDNSDPTVLLDMGGYRVREAVRSCSSGWWANVHTYYGVRADDKDADGVQVIPDSFSMNEGGWIRDFAGNDAILTHGTNPAKKYNEVAGSPSTAVLQSAPAISGNATVGSTLTANTAGLTAIGASGFTYRWTADDVTITGATGSTHTLTANEAGKTIRVYVYFTNRGGKAEITRSAGVGPVNQAPVFPDDVDTTLAVAENSPARTNVGDPVTATDPDDDTLAYSLSGTDAASFEIGSSTGQITTKSDVTYDYEAKSSYSLSVTAADGRGGTVSVAVTVNLTDVEETTTSGEGGTAPQESNTEPVNRAPAFDAGIVTTLAVDENSAAGTNVGSPITATDPDQGDTLVYSLSGTDAASFDIGGSTGQITTKSGVTYNYEAKSSYSLAVKVSDGNGHTVSVAVAVSLNDLGEAPKVSDTTQFKTHNATVGAAFSMTLPAADANSGDGGPYDYLLWHKGAGKNFEDQAINGLNFNPTTRTLSGTPEADGTWEMSYVVHDGDANRNAAADAFRERDKLKIVVAAAGDTSSDGNGEGGTAPQESNTESANRAPAFDASIVTTLKVDENSAAGTNVGSPITATDPDDGDTVTYSLSGTDAASFDIGGSTGQITTKTGVTYNYEAKSSYSLAVTASDGKLSNSTPVTVNLNNVNEAPAFAGSSTTLKVDENSAAGTNVGSPITATDPDDGDTVTYSLTGTDAASFDIGSSTGQITTKTGVTYDYEAKPSYSLTVEATDAKGLSDSIAVTVNLNDVNEAPAFAGPSATLEIPENSGANVSVGDAVTATDTDSGDMLTYSLSGADSASFAIDATGQITTKSGVTYDYEAKPSYSLTVDATDAKGLSDSIGVTVNLNDATAATACVTGLGTLTAAALYEGQWDDSDCAAHHQDGRARYSEFTVPEQTSVTISLTAGTLYVSKGTPNNGWGTAPKGTYEHRREVRRANGKLLHDGNNAATLTLAAGETYTVEAAGAAGGTFTVSIAPQ